MVQYWSWSNTGTGTGLILVLVLVQYWSWSNTGTGPILVWYNTGPGSILVLVQYWYRWYWSNIGSGPTLVLVQYWYWSNTGIGSPLICTWFTTEDFEGKKKTLLQGFTSVRFHLPWLVCTLVWWPSRWENRYCWPIRHISSPAGMQCSISMRYPVTRNCGLWQMF